MNTRTGAFLITANSGVPVREDSSGYSKGLHGILVITLTVVKDESGAHNSRPAEGTTTVIERAGWHMDTSAVYLAAM